MRPLRRALLWALLAAASPARAEEGFAAAFREFPVGAGPAALGGAYTALARDAYAPAYNPGGMAVAVTPQAALQHGEQLEGLYFEHASVVVPMKRRHAVGGLVQYLGAQDLERTDEFGIPAGRYRSYFGVAGLSYSVSLGRGLSIGATGKVIRGQLDNVHATTHAADLGALYRVSSRVTVGAAVQDLGAGLRFLSRRDPLPTTYKLGAAWQPAAAWTAGVDADYRPRGPEEARAGLEWRIFRAFVLRAGYRADLGGESREGTGLSVGGGFFFEGQELSYAWVPLGRLGSANYFSFVWRFMSYPDREQDAL